MATKTVPAKKIKIVLQAGETLIGENKVQALKLNLDYALGFVAKGQSARISRA